MARAIRSRKFISRSNGSSYPFKKIHQPFEWLELSVRKNRQPFEWLELSVWKNRQPFEWLEPSIRENSLAIRMARAIRSKKIIGHSNGSSYQSRKKQPTSKQFAFVKWRMPSCWHYINGRHVSVLSLLSLKWHSVHCLGKNIWFTNHKLLLNRKPCGPYMFVAALEPTPRRLISR